MLFHKHRWEFLRLSYYTDTSYGLTPAKSTMVFWKCRCGEIQTDSHYGIVFVEDDFK